MRIEVHKSEELAIELAKYLLSKIIYGFIDNDRITLALSGGNTPKKTYEWLGKYLCSEEILGEGRELLILQVDERYTSYENDRSNQKMIREAVQCEKEKQLIFNFIPTTDTTNSFDEAVKKYEQSLSDVLEKNIDIIILGMGSDGHTASLFPNNKDYINSIKNDKWVLGTYVEKQAEERISLTPQLISQSGLKILLITGVEKGIILARAEKSNDPIKFPIKQGLDRNTVIFMDEECHKAYIEEKLQ